MSQEGAAEPNSGLEAPQEGATQVGRARILFALALGGVILYVALDALAQSLPPHYSPVSQTEGLLAVGPYGYIMTLNFINRGVFSLCFLFGLALTVNAADVMTSRFRRGGYLFGAWSVGALLLAAFPADLGGAPSTWHGMIHFVVAIVAYMGGALGSLYLSLGTARNSSAGRARRMAIPLALLTAPLCGVVLLGGLAAPGFFAGYGGLVQRVFLGSVLLWIGAVSAVLLGTREARAGESPPSRTLN